MVAVRIMTPADVETQPIEPYYLQQRRLATSQDFGSEIGQAMGEAGHAIGALGSLASHLQTQRQDATDNIAAETWRIQDNQYHSDQLNQAQKTAQPGAPDFAKNYLSSTSEDQTKRLADFQKQYSVSDRGMQRLQLTSLQNQAEWGSRAVTWENNQAVANLQDTTAKNIDDIMASGAAHGDFASVIKNRDSILAAAAASHIMDPEQLQKLRDAAQKTTLSAFQTWASNTGAAGFADNNDAKAKWAQFNSNLDLLDIPQGEKDLNRQVYQDEFGQRYVEQHPDEFQSPTIHGSAAGGAGIGADPAVRLLQHFEGFSPNPYNDKGSLRIGFGSDTVTKPDGSVARVTPGMRITREDAMRDLQRRIPDFANVAHWQVGDVWRSLDVNTRSALTSVTYNYGSLPSEVVAAVKSGDKEAIASAVEGLSANKGRRAEEAAVIRGGGAPSQTLTGPPSGFPFPGMSTGAYQDAQAKAYTANEAEIRIQEKAQKDASEQAANGYMTRLLKNDPADVQGIVNQIADDPALTFETKKSLGEAAAHQLAESDVGSTKSYGPGFWNAYKAVTSGPDDPSHIGDMTPLFKRAGPGGDLTIAGVEKLHTVMDQNRRSVDDKAVNDTKAALLTHAKDMISFDGHVRFPGDNGLADPVGRDRFNAQFIPAFEAAYDKWVQAGKDPWQFLTKENVDKIAAPFVRSQKEMNADLITANRDTIQPQPQTHPFTQQEIPEAPTDVNRDGWNAVVGRPPQITDDKQFPVGNWVKVINWIRSDPTPENIKIFNDKGYIDNHGNSITAEDVLGSLQGGAAVKPAQSQLTQPAPVEVPAVSSNPWSAPLGANAAPVQPQAWTTEGQQPAPTTVQPVQPGDVSIPGQVVVPMKGRRSAPRPGSLKTLKVPSD